MKQYTEQQLLSAIEYACQMQKAEDYQVAGKHLLTDKDKDDAIENCLNELYKTDVNEASKITIQEIDLYLEKGWNV